MEELEKKSEPSTTEAGIKRRDREARKAEKKAPEYPCTLIASI